jgi:hypothetical protein
MFKKIKRIVELIYNSIYKVFPWQPVAMIMSTGVIVLLLGLVVSGTMITIYSVGGNLLPSTIRRFVALWEIGAFVSVAVLILTAMVADLMACVAIGIVELYKICKNKLAVPH